jgi:Cystathionine beta-lyases/cystathionine gamma-synthases
MSIISTTKYYSRHSDAKYDKIAGNKKTLKIAEQTNKITRLRLSPDDAYLKIRRVRTLHNRIEKHQENAKNIAARLLKNKKNTPLYPHKKNSPNPTTSKKYYKAPSPPTRPKIKSKKKNSVKKFKNSPKLFSYGYSWGGCEKIALHQENAERGYRRILNLKKDEHLKRPHI